MNIHIVYANVGAISNPQAQIVGAQYEFVCQQQLRFQVFAPAIFLHIFLLTSWAVTLSWLARVSQGDRVFGQSWSVALSIQLSCTLALFLTSSCTIYSRRSGKLVTK